MVKSRSQRPPFVRRLLSRIGFVHHLLFIPGNKNDVRRISLGNLGGHHLLGLGQIPPKRQSMTLRTPVRDLEFEIFMSLLN